MSEYLKLPEVAQRLGVSEKTARRYVKQGALPSVFVGGAYRVTPEDVAAFLENARVPPKKDPAPPSLEPTLNDVLEEERRENLERALTALIKPAADIAEELKPDLIFEAIADLRGALERATEEPYRALLSKMLDRAQHAYAMRMGGAKLLHGEERAPVRGEDHGESAEIG